MREKLTGHRIGLFIALQIMSWFGCLFMAGTFLEILCITLVALNMISARMLFGKTLKSDWLKVFLTGVVFDQVLISSGAFSAGGTPLIPLWKICFWLIFAMGIPGFGKLFENDLRKRNGVLISSGILFSVIAAGLEIFQMTSPFSWLLVLGFWMLLPVVGLIKKN